MKHILDSYAEEYHILDSSDEEYQQFELWGHFRDVTGQDRILSWFEEVGDPIQGNFNEVLIR